MLSRAAFAQTTDPTTQPASAIPAAPNAETVAGWVGFSRPVSLESQTIKGGDYARWGKPIWITGYQATNQTLASYVIAVYERGTYNAKNRAKLEELISENAKRFAGTETGKYMQVETRPDGRKVFFNILGFGPGGTLLGGFTSLPDCDLVVTQLNDSQKGKPDSQRLKDPASPTNELPAVFQQVEQYLQSARD